MFCVTKYKINKLLLADHVCDCGKGNWMRIYCEKCKKEVIIVHKLSADICSKCRTVIKNYNQTIVLN